MDALGKIVDKRRDRMMISPSKLTRTGSHGEPEKADVSSGYFSNYLGLRRRRKDGGQEEEIPEKISMAA